MSRNQELGAIAGNVQTSLKSFRNLLDAIKEQNDSVDPNQLLDKFEDDIARFKMWAGNLGAHQSGQASLDHRLREAPHLHEQVVYLLKDLCDSLEDARALVCRKPPSWRRAQHRTDDEGDKSSSKDVTGHIGEDIELSDSDSDDSLPENGLLTLHTDVSEAIDCLLRLSVAIANPVPHERARKFTTGASDDVSFYETTDVRYVQDKFPKMNTQLSEHLGKSITRRRQFFKYREAHHAKLSAGLEAIAGGAETSRSEIFPKTVASSLPEHLKSSANVSLVINEDGRSETGISQTSYATSAGFLMEEQFGGHMPPPPLKVPPLPAAAEGKHFDCPFCFRVISASTQAAWKRHVFGDLRPYVCIFPDCDESNTDFDRRHRWQMHISQYHWRSWSCPFKCEGVFKSASDLRLHLNRNHLPNALEEQLDAVTTLGERTVSDDVSNECRICGHTVVGPKSYIKHVGRHLEQLALFALPSLGNEDMNASNEDKEDGSDISSFSAKPSNISANASQRLPSRSVSPVHSTSSLRSTSSSRVSMDFTFPRNPGSTPIHHWEYARMSLATPTPSPQPNWLDSTTRQPAARATHGRVNSYSQQSTFSGTGESPYETLQLPAEALVDKGKRKVRYSEAETGQVETEMEKVDDEGIPIPSEEPRYCLCNQVSFGTMIQCDNIGNCKQKWFHLQCVGLSSIPAKWYCPVCRELLDIGENESRFPQGQCRYILNARSLIGERCACVAFNRNKGVPGMECDCGHSSDFHLSAKDKEDRPPMATSPPQIASIMDRRRPLSSGSSHQASMNEPVVISMKPSHVPRLNRDEYGTNRPVSHLRRNESVDSTNGPTPIVSTSKALPLTLPELSSANDQIAHLSARLEYLNHRRIQINKSIKQMTELVPQDNLIASAEILHKRELDKTLVEGLRETLAEIKQEEHEVGLRLHRSYKRMDRQ